MMYLSEILEFHACLCHTNDVYHQSDCSFQCNTTIFFLFFFFYIWCYLFVVIDLKHHVVDLLQLKPVHAVLQESNSRIQINGYIFLLFTVCNLICFVAVYNLFTTHMHGNVILWNNWVSLYQTTLKWVVVAQTLEKRSCDRLPLPHYRHWGAHEQCP